MNKVSFSRNDLPNPPELCFSFFGLVVVRTQQQQQRRLLGAVVESKYIKEKNTKKPFFQDSRALDKFIVVKEKDKNKRFSTFELDLKKESALPTPLRNIVKDNEINSKDAASNSSSLDTASSSKDDPSSSTASSLPPLLRQVIHYNFTQQYPPPLSPQHVTSHESPVLGATCYLNSLLQQFFLIAPLRHGVLSTTLPPDHDHKLLTQLQLLFANLQSSERRDCDTTGLCAAIKGYDGNPVRPGEQQDVVEFFNLFGDRLETLLKPSKQRYLLQDIFGGELCHVIICQDCKHRSERPEDCLSLSLDVKGKTNIAESLKLYIQGESLDGDNQYYCEKCQAKRDSLKMCCVSSLPNTLILHLKRFEFDLELMRKIKVNDRFEYPLELNMKPFTKEGLTPPHENNNDDDGSAPYRPDDYYRYRLRGVLVHSGTADSGHYYSLARDDSFLLQLSYF